MQAGVPIVPIVIRNAGDVAPKGDFVFRPATVDVEVLPPVDTSGWRLQDLDRHVREVRQLFLDCLGQQEEAEPVPGGRGRPRVGAKARARPSRADGGRKTSTATRKNTAGKTSSNKPATRTAVSRKSAKTVTAATAVEAGPDDTAPTSPRRRSRGRPQGASGA
jgi:putative phosphoserine phosphatase/1-acylglycerol-3-phosphate O-acyltransferase